MDWRHLLVKMHQAFHDQPKLVSELTDYLYSGRGKEMLSTVKLAKLLCEEEEKRQKITYLVTYIEHNWDGP